MLFHGTLVRLRKMTLDDAKRYHEWRNDPELTQFTYPTIDAYSLADTEKFVEQITQSANSKTYFIEENQHGKPIGITSLIEIDWANRHAEGVIDIGDKNYWGKGYGTEALGLLLELAFCELNLHRISLRVFSFNERAIKSYQKLGFVIEGVQKEVIFRNGEWHDVHFMGLLQRHYLSQHNGD
ncbi:GNAT family N-acetyltransferase [Camelliibacillus cellulosilyticus]|uniref:GNAT family N-acetyltransferase n=1 Tax=Camelliibacillus cellulosilyticus TaxID=2174486 RepID=A0ABV9GPX9_9BACL